MKSFKTTLESISESSGVYTIGIPGAGKKELENLGTMFANAGNFCNGETNKQIFWMKDCNGKVYTVYKDGEDYKTTDKIELTVNQDEVCVTYPEVHANCDQLIVNAAYAPKEFSLFLTGKLFQGDSCKKSDGKYVAKLVIEIPRFQLDGTVDLTLNPSSAATMDLNGTALAYGCNCGEDAQGEYAKMSIIPVNSVAGGDEKDPYEGYTKIVVQDADALKQGEPVIVYMAGEKKMPVPYKGKIEAKAGEVGDGATVLAENGFMLKDDATVGKALVTAVDIKDKPTYSITITAKAGE